MTATEDRGELVPKPHGATGKSSRVKRFARFVLRGGRRRVPAAGRLSSRPKLLVFDFDGTVADTFQCGLEILNSMASEFGYRQLEAPDLPRVRDMRTRELLKFLGIPATRLPKISKRGKEELSKRMDEILPFAGIAEIVRTLHTQGFRLGILTSNSEENVSVFLKKFDLEHFDFIYTSSKLTGKARVIRRILKESKLRPRQVLLVGDEVRDIEAAQATGIHMAAVTWGYNSRSSLASLNPDHVLESPADLAVLVCGFPA
jgi:HAD superfamily hydrolase (TIGR01549 family)